MKTLPAVIQQDLGKLKAVSLDELQAAFFAERPVQGFLIRQFWRYPHGLQRIALYHQQTRQTITLKASRWEAISPIVEGSIEPEEHNHLPGD